MKNSRHIRWRASALADLQRIHDWLSAIESAQPDRAILRIRAAVESLGRLGDIGRPSRVTGLRELTVRDAPYVIAYRVHANAIEILAVYHNAQRR